MTPKGQEDSLKSVKVRAYPIILFAGAITNLGHLTLHYLHHSASQLSSQPAALANFCRGCLKAGPRVSPP